MSENRISIFPEDPSKTTEKREIIDRLLAFPRQCIYALINPKDRKIFISYSRNLLFSIGRNIDQINDDNHVCSRDKDLIELLIIETVKQEKDLRLRYRFWEEYFKQNGYSFYRNIKTINYRTRIEIIKRAKDKKSLLAVKLISNNSRSMEVVGLFEKMEDAEAFKEKHYKGTILKVVYADNEDTKEYLKWIKTQS